MKERVFDARRPRQGSAPAGKSLNPRTSSDFEHLAALPKKLIRL